jgi:hypothetical protein
MKLFDFDYFINVEHNHILIVYSWSYVSVCSLASVINRFLIDFAELNEIMSNGNYLFLYF